MNITSLKQFFFKTIFHMGPQPVQILTRIDPKMVKELKRLYSREWWLLQIFVIHWETWETYTSLTQSSKSSTFALGFSSLYLNLYIIPFFQAHYSMLMPIWMLSSPSYYDLVMKWNVNQPHLLVRQRTAV